MATMAENISVTVLLFSVKGKVFSNSVRPCGFFNEHYGVVGVAKVRWAKGHGKNTDNRGGL